MSAGWRSLPRVQKFYLAIATSAMLLFVIFLKNQTVPFLASSNELQNPREQAANSTLGFEKILAVSAHASWRTRGLTAAAKYTSLDITIPEQPYIHDDVVAAFQEIGSHEENLRRPAPGSAKAWLAHLDMLKYVVMSGLSTALIIEDDVDWDVSIHDQMRLLSDSVRMFTSVPPIDNTPFGTVWEVLWIGHCGEVTRPEQVKVEYTDPSTIPAELYAGWSKKWIADVPPGNRVVQRTRQTVCTFGYGVTQNGARAILKNLGGGRNQAFDIALMSECKNGNVQCLTVNPELMHHYNPQDGAGYISPSREGNSGGHSAAEQFFEHLKGTTANIPNSARCAALFNDVCMQAPT